MAASGEAARKASRHMPYCDNQGIDFIAGAGTMGGCVQGGVYVMSTGGAVSFAALGLSNMAVANYIVVITNTSGTAAAKVARDATRTASGFVVTGPANGDMVEFIVYGPLAGVLYK